MSAFLDKLKLVLALTDGQDAEITLDRDDCEALLRELTDVATARREAAETAAAVADRMKQAALQAATEMSEETLRAVVRTSEGIAAGIRALPVELEEPR